MENSGFVSFKVYLIESSPEANEIRRFGCEPFEATSYANFVKTITEVFPGLSKKQFRIYWLDDDGDNVAVSSDAELLIALTTMKPDVKKFYVKVDAPLTGAPQAPPEGDNPEPHPGVYCDGCNGDIAGTRYKCLKCRDFDLCRQCEQTGIHAEHPMIKIPHPSCFDRLSLHTATELIGATIPIRSGHRRHHSRDGGHSDSHKKKKRSERRGESGPETGDEGDDVCHKKHSHKKCKKQAHGEEGPREGKGGCRRATLHDAFHPYCRMMDFFSPINFQGTRSRCEDAGKTQEDAGHLAYLKTVGSTIQKLLDPLGVNVEFEVRPKEEKKPEESKKEEKKPEEEKGGPAPSAPPQKEVHFAAPAQPEAQGVEEITKILANQTMSSGSSRTSPENDGWVSFEELKKESEEGHGGAQGEAQGGPKGPSAPHMETDTAAAAATTSSAPQGTTNLYPILGGHPVSDRVRGALNQMLSMGFTNDGDWLTHLLEAKQGDINQALEVLAPHKKQ